MRVVLAKQARGELPRGIRRRVDEMELKAAMRTAAFPMPVRPVVARRASAASLPQATWISDARNPPAASASAAALAPAGVSMTPTT